MLRIQLFGRPHVTDESTTVSFAGRRKAVPLLAFLLLHAGAPVSREYVASSLWPEDSDSDARANLRRHLAVLTASLPHGEALPWIIASPQTVQWNSESTFCFDVAEFRSLAADPAGHEEAVRLYAGDLLEAIDEPWLTEPRRDLSIRYTSCLLSLIALYRSRRSFYRAQEYARTLLAYDPWREDALRQLLILLYEAGDRASAMRAFRLFQDALRREIGAEPMPETIAVFRAIENGIAPPGASPPASASKAYDARGEPPLVGRGAELKLLNEAWHDAAAGHGRAVLLCGQAGIGKSRLARDFSIGAEAEGAFAVTGITDVHESMPYQAITAIVRSLVNLPNVNIEPIWLSSVRTIAPELAAHLPGAAVLPALDALRERARLFEAIAMVFERCAANRPIVAIVEDIHWAGRGSIELCRYLFSRLRASRICWLFTLREEDAPGNAALHEFRRVFDAQPGCRCLPLKPLTLSDTQELLLRSGRVHDANAKSAAEQLHERCGGNPFYTLAVAEEPDAISGGGALPAAIRDAIIARIEALPERPRTFLQIASVVGASIDLELVTESAGWYTIETNDAVEALLDYRLIKERGGISFEFAHDFVHSAVYASLENQERTRRHHRVAHVLERLHGEREERAGEIARHYDLAGDPHPAARFYLRAAGFALSVYAHEEATAHAQRALTLGTSPQMRFEALDLIQRTAALQGDRDAQDRSTQLLIEVSRSLATDAQGQALRARIDYANAIAAHTQERELIARLKILAQNHRAMPWLASALEAEVKLLRSTGEFDEERAAFAKLLTLGTPGIDKRAYTAAYLSHADTLIYQGNLEEAHTILNDVRASLNPVDNQSELVRTLSAFSRAALAQQDYALMSEFAREAYSISRSIGDVEGEALSLHNIANGLVYTFHVNEARDAYERTIELYRRIGHRIGLASVNVDFGLFHNELGLLDEAMAYYQRALEIAEEIDFQFVTSVGHVNVSYCQRLLGNFVAAKSAASLALRTARALRSTLLESAALGTLAAAERDLGELAEADADFRRGIALRRGIEPSSRLGDNLCGLASTQLLRREITAARETAIELTALYDANPRLAPQPTEWLGTAAQVFSAAGDPERAAALLHQATSVMNLRAEAIEDARTRSAFLDLSFNRALQIRC